MALFYYISLVCTTLLFTGLPFYSKFRHSLLTNKLQLLEDFRPQTPGFIQTARREILYIDPWLSQREKSSIVIAEICAKRRQFVVFCD